MTELRIKKLTESAIIPKYQTKGAAGFDLHADESAIVVPGEYKMISTGLAVAVPYGCEGQVRSRSGLAAKNGVMVLNSPGTIDHDYRGEIKVILINHGKDSFTINKGDRIAQMIINEFKAVSLIETDELDETSRGTGGFGSTGV